MYVFSVYKTDSSDVYDVQNLVPQLLGRIVIKIIAVLRSDHIKTKFVLAGSNLDSALVDFSFSCILPCLLQRLRRGDVFSSDLPM